MISFVTILPLFLLFATSCTAQISRQECIDQGGQVVSDIGDGSIFRPDYVCDATAEPPTDTVEAQEGESMAREGEVCCGGTGAGIDSTGSSSIGEEEGSSLSLPETTDATTAREEMTRQECTDLNGSIAGDIGNGAIFQDDYLCDSNGLPPLANIVPSEGEPIAIEGEVCCGASENTSVGEENGLPLPETTDATTAREEMTHQECMDLNGSVVGDIGNGAIFQDDYLCDSNGLPPLANIVPSEGEPIAIEGEVCCGASEKNSSAGRGMISKVFGSSYWIGYMALLSMGLFV